MAISFINAASAAGADSVTCPSSPGPQAGDLLIVVSVRQHDTLNPGTPSGFTMIAQGGTGSSLTHKVSYKIADGTEGGTAITSGSSIGSSIAIYRGTHATAPVNATSFGQSITLSATNSFATFTFDVTDGTSWVVGALSGSGDANDSNPPTGMTFRTGNETLNQASTIHDTNGGVSSWGTTGVGLTGASRHAVWAVEIKAAAGSTGWGGRMSTTANRLVRP